MKRNLNGFELPSHIRYRDSNPKIDIYQWREKEQCYAYWASTNWFRTLAECAEFNSTIRNNPDQKWALCRSGSSRLTKIPPSGSTLVTKPQQNTRQSDFNVLH